MVKLINKHFGNEMLVAESRVEEYLSSSHKLADVPTTKEKPKSKPKAKKTK